MRTTVFKISKGFGYKKEDNYFSPEVAIYTIDELIQKSRSYNLFSTEPYRINKGSFRDPDGVVHLAPRFGIFQMQRAGNKQHPTQLQFNLKSGYFYVI